MARTQLLGPSSSSAFSSALAGRWFRCRAAKTWRESPAWDVSRLTHCATTPTSSLFLVTLLLVSLYFSFHHPQVASICKDIGWANRPLASSSQWLNSNLHLKSSRLSISVQKVKQKTSGKPKSFYFSLSVMTRLPWQTLPLIFQLILSTWILPFS